jgi:hypothetical protein
MTYNVNIYFREQYLTTVYDVEASSEAEAIDLVTENLEIDFEVEPNE